MMKCAQQQYLQVHNSKSGITQSHAANGTNSHVNSATYFGWKSKSTSIVINKTLPSPVANLRTTSKPSPIHY